MSSEVNFLEGFVPEEDFAQGTEVCRRTIARYRRQPDGLPYMEWGGRIYIPVNPGREWIQKRVRRANPTKKGSFV